MNAVLARTAPEPEPATKRRLRNRRDESGLTTLEWLLIVAAVAGLAALAVVLVTRVVSDTSEDIAGQSARKTAATLAAQALTDEARATVAASNDDAVSLNTEYKRKCNRLKITYVDVEGLDVLWSTDVTVDNPVAGDVTTETVWATDPKKYGCHVS